VIWSIRKHSTHDVATARGESQLSTLLAYSIDALGNPFVGGFIGLVCAAGLLFVSRSSFRLVTPESSFAGLILATMLLFARLLAVTLALWAYKSVAPTGFKPFAITLAGGFLVMYTFEVIRYAGLLRPRRPAGIRQ
jgi:hypothetical protein